MTTVLKPETAAAMDLGPTWEQAAARARARGGKHLPGQHNQLDHGRRGSTVEGGTVVPGVPDLISEGWVAGIVTVRDEMTQAVADVGQPAPELYRGMHNNRETERFIAQVQDAIGGTIEFKASSFTEDKSVAHEFTSMVRSGNASEEEDVFMSGGVVITVTPGAQAVDVQPAAQTSVSQMFAWQKEWVTAGTFRVDSGAYSSKGVFHVHLTQTETP